MNETQIQNRLATELIDRGHEHVVPNVSCWGRTWEADLVSVTKSGYAYEWKIKLTSADFRRDKRKDRHTCLKDTYEKGRRNRRIGTWRGAGPSRFFYVLGPDVDSSGIEVPDYAGVVDAGSHSLVLTGTKMTDAPRLHNEKIKEDVKGYLARGLMWRYWEARETST
jgi:hypothetical protein